MGITEQLRVRVGANISSYEKSMGKVGKIALGTAKIISGAFAAVILVSAKIGSEFQQTMTETATVAGAFGKDLKALEDKARSLGATTAFTATQAAKGMYSLACLPAGEKILGGDFRVHPIEKYPDIDIIGSNGLPQKIKEFTSRKCDEGLLYEIKPKNLRPFKVTGNHPIYVIKSKYCKPSTKNKLCKNSCNEYCTKKYYEDYKPEWVRAEDLKQGDILLQPIIKEEKDININWSFIRRSKQQRNLPTILDRDLTRFLGIILGDGWADKKEQRVFCAFSDKDKESKTWFVDYVENKLGYSIHEKQMTNCVQLVFWSVPIARLIGDWIGHGAYNKRIPPELFHAKKDIIKSFIKGYLDSDGCFYYDKNDRPVISITTISPHIAYFFNYLSSKVEGIFSISFDDKKKHNRQERLMPSGYICKLKDSYVLKNTDKNFISNFYELREDCKEQRYKKVWIENGYVYHPIAKITKEVFYGKVYNFETEDNTYSTGVIVHNSAGLEAKDIISATEHAMKLAGATGGEMTQATGLLASTMKQFGIEAEDARKITDTFAGAITGSQLTLAGLITAMQFAGPIAASLGWSIEEAVAAVAAFRDMGLDASKAGTSLRKAMSSLLDPTEKAKDKLEDLGISLADIDPVANTFGDILRILGGSDGDISKAKDETIKLKKSLSDTVQPMKDTKDETIKLKKSLSDTVQPMKDTKDVMEKLGGESGVVTAAGDAIGIMATNTATAEDETGKLVTNTSDLIKPMEDVATNSLDAAKQIQGLGDASTAAKNATIIFGDRAGPLMASLAKAAREGKLDYEKFTQSLKDSQKGLGRTAEMYDRMMDTFQGKWKRVVSALQDLAIEFFGTYENQGMSLFDTLSGKINEFTGFVRENKDVITKFFKGLFTIGEGALNAIGPPLKLIAQVLGGVLLTFNALPDVIKGTAGTGILAFILLRGFKASKFTILLTTILTVLDAVSDLSKRLGLAASEAFTFAEAMSMSNKEIETAIKGPKSIDQLNKELKKLEEELEPIAKDFEKIEKRVFRATEAIRMGFQNSEQPLERHKIGLNIIGKVYKDLKLKIEKKAALIKTTTEGIIIPNLQKETKVVKEEAEEQLKKYKEISETRKITDSTYYGSLKAKAIEADSFIGDLDDTRGELILSNRIIHIEKLRAIKEKEFLAEIAEADKIVEKMQSTAEEKEKILDTLYGILGPKTEDYFNRTIEKLDEEKGKYEELFGGNDAVISKINTWYFGKRDKLAVDSGVLAIGEFDSWKTAVKVGLEDQIGVGGPWPVWSNAVATLVGTLYGSIQKGLSDAFFAMATNMDSLDDVWKDFTGSLLRMFTDMLAQMAVQYAGSAIIRTLSGGSLDLVSGSAPNIVSTGTTVAGIGSRLAGLFGGGAAAGGAPTALNVAMTGGMAEAAAAHAAGSAITSAGVGLVPGLGIAAATWFAMDYLAGLTPRGKLPTQQELAQARIDDIVSQLDPDLSPSGFGVPTKTTGQVISELDLLSSTSENQYLKLIAQNISNELKEQQQINITLNIDGKAVSNVIIDQLRHNTQLNEALQGVR